ncbi:MAG: hypothetical protein GX354_04020 [Firmicutes bacterium]|nr:hypothetical protein [Bacillota bacterium]
MQKTDIPVNGMNVPFISSGKTAEWVHACFASPFGRAQVLDEQHVQIWGKDFHNNRSGMLSRTRLSRENSRVEVGLSQVERGAALVLYGGNGGWERALELILTEGKVMVTAVGAGRGESWQLSQASVDNRAKRLTIHRHGDLFACYVEEQLVWRGSLPFDLPAARILLRAAGKVDVLTPEYSAVFGPVLVSGVVHETVLSGRLVNADGKPLAGSVHIAGDPFAVAKTDASGRFEVSFAPLGDDALVCGAVGTGWRVVSARELGNGGGCPDICITEEDQPRSEYPRPDFDRSTGWWQNLNGTWWFALDPDDMGQVHNWVEDEQPYRHVIRVPFPWTSLLACGEEDFASADHYTGIWGGYTGTAWYRRKVTVAAQFPQGQIGVLKCGAVGLVAEVYWDGKLVGQNEGGYAPFECELGELKAGSEHSLVVRVSFPREFNPIDFSIGKQGWWFSHTPGIWQTVWLEARSPQSHIQQLHVRPEVHFASNSDLEPSNTTFLIKTEIAGKWDYLVVKVLDPDGNEVAKETIRPNMMVGSSQEDQEWLQISIQDPRLWDVDDPNLYTVGAHLYSSDRLIDRVSTYCGLRQIRCDWADGESMGNAQSGTQEEHGGYQYVFLNNRPLYVIGILDQAYNPWGLYTYTAYDSKPGSILEDIRITKQQGYNLNRLHIKQNEPLWLYAAAVNGLLVWDEIPNSLGTPTSESWERWLRQYYLQHRRDFNCPAIVIRSLFNEAWGIDDLRTNPATQAKVLSLVKLQRALEPHRLVVDNSAAQGYPNRHLDTDINDEHVYLRDWWEWRRKLELIQREIYPGSPYNFHSGQNESDEVGDARQSGQPYIMSEFTSDNGKTLALRMFPRIAGFVKIDLTDYEWELHSAFTYDRLLKPLQYLDADFEPVGDEMEHSLDAVVLDTGPINYLRKGGITIVPIYVAAFHRKLAHYPVNLHTRVVGERDDGSTFILEESKTEVPIRPFSVTKAGVAEVRRPKECERVFLFTWLTRDGRVTARNLAHWVGM